jgi:hypothetical protein
MNVVEFNVVLVGSDQTVDSPSMYKASKDKKTANLAALDFTSLDTSASITDEMVMRFNAEV